MARSWIARPVESKTVMSPSDVRPSAVTDQNVTQLRYVVALQPSGLDRVHELPVVARLLPVVAENTDTCQLLDGNLCLARPVGSHQARVLTGAQ